MFDNTYISPPAVNVRVNQQPNDAADAARLYGELVSKAADEVRTAVLDRFGVDNELMILKVTSEVHLATEQRRTRVLFRLAGREYDIYSETEQQSRTEMIRAVAESVAIEVAAKLMRIVK